MDGRCVGVGLGDSDFWSHGPSRTGNGKGLNFEGWKGIFTGVGYGEQE